jgi:hypothetical protein
LEHYKEESGIFHFFYSLVLFSPPSSLHLPLSLSLFKCSQRENKRKSACGTMAGGRWAGGCVWEAENSKLRPEKEGEQIRKEDAEVWCPLSEFGEKNKRKRKKSKRRRAKEEKELG